MPHVQYEESVCGKKPQTNKQTKINAMKQTKQKVCNPVCGWKISNSYLFLVV